MKQNINDENTAENEYHTMNKMLRITDKLIRASNYKKSIASMIVAIIFLSTLLFFSFVKNPFDMGAVKYYLVFPSGTEEETDQALQMPADYQSYMEMQANNYNQELLGKSESTKLLYMPFAIFFFMVSTYFLNRSITSRVLHGILSFSNFFFLIIWISLMIFTKESSEINLIVNIVLLFEWTLILIIVLIQTSIFPMKAVKFIRIISAGCIGVLWLVFVFFLLSLVSLNIQKFFIQILGFIGLIEYSPESEYIYYMTLNHIVQGFNYIFDIILLLCLGLWSSLLIFSIAKYKEHFEDMGKIELYLKRKFKSDDIKVIS